MRRMSQWLSRFCSTRSELLHFIFFVSAQVSGLIWGNPTPPEISSNIFSNLLSYKGVRQEIASPMWIQRGIIFPVSELNLVPSVSAGNEWFHTPHLQLCLWTSILRDMGHGVYSLPRSHGWAKKMCCRGFNCQDPIVLLYLLARMKSNSNTKSQNLTETFPCLNKVGSGYFTSHNHHHKSKTCFYVSGRGISKSSEGINNQASKEI